MSAGQPELDGRGQARALASGGNGIKRNGNGQDPGTEGLPPKPGQAVPASGAWQPGDPVGQRLFAQLGSFQPEQGGALDVTVAYETWGQLNAARDNAVLVLHALTGDSHIRGPAGPGHPTAGWWTKLIGPGAPVDTDRYFVVAPNTLGGCQGTTGPASMGPDGRPWGSLFPYITIRDQVQSSGYSLIGRTEQNITNALNETDAMNQLDLIKLQQQTTQYANTISMMTTILKNLGDSDKEVIRNC